MRVLGAAGTGRDWTERSRGLEHSWSYGYDYMRSM